MLSPTTRITQRYLTPRWVASLYFLLRYRCIVSTLARVQLTSRVTFGRGAVVKPFAVLTTHSGRIQVGRKCAISSFDHISAGDSDIVIGDFTRLGPNVTLLGGSREFRRRDLLVIEQGSHDPGLRVGNDVLVGAGSVVLPGCDIAEGAVVGAGSVVNAPVAAYSIVAGSPARVVGQRE